MTDAGRGGILVVDDAHASLKMLTDMLEAEGYAVRPADSGRLALGAAKASQPELIVLDIRMPEMDGFEVFQQLQLDDRTKGIPVIFIVGEQDSAHRVEGMRLGAVDFITRPFDRERTLARIATHFQLSKLRHVVVDQAQDLKVVSERNRAILETAMDGYWLADTDGRLLEVNNTYCKMSGYSEAELLTMSISDIEAAESQQDTADHIREILDKGEDRFESRHRRRDGSTFEVEISSQFRPTDDGDWIVVFSRDVTTRKQAERTLRDSEARLRESEAMYRSVITATPDDITITDLDGRVLMASPAALVLTGCEREDQLLGRSIADFIVPEDRDRAAANVALMFAGVSTGLGEYRGMRLDGSTFDMEANAEFIRDVDGQPTGMVFVVRDVTERQQLLSAVRLSESKFSTAFRISPDAVNINRLSDGLYVEVNTGFTRLTGYTAQDVAGKTSAQISIWNDPADRDRLVAGLLADGLVSNLEAVFVRKDGTQVIALMSAQVIQVDGQQCILSVTRDISARRAAEDAAREQSEMIRLLLDSTVEAIHGLDIEGRINLVNAASRTMLGYEHDEDVLGRVGHEIMHHTRADGSAYPLEECPIHSSLASGTPVHCDDEVFWRADGTSFPVEYWSHPLRKDGDVVGAVLTFVDITERRQLEDALQRRVIALTQPPASSEGLAFSDLFDVEDIQAVQDAFSDATGVASIITQPDGTPITRPSNFCRLCTEVIRGTEQGRINCMKSDAVIGSHDPAGPVVQPCLSGGLWDAGTSISVGGHHIANWLIGQVRNDQQSDDKLLEYADVIGVDRMDFKAALAEVPTMPLERFERIAAALFSFAKELSVIAYQNMQQARFITEQQRVEGEILSLNTDLEQRERERAIMTERLAGMLTAVVEVVGNVSEMRDPHTAGHQRRVAQLATAIAAEMGMSEDDIADIRVAALMHDVGKISVPVEILSRPGALTPTEFRLVQGHAQAGHDIIASSHIGGPIAELVYQHHERSDGSGYPRGLLGDDLLLGSKVLIVSDVAEAMMSHRPYRTALGEEAALAEIEQGAGRTYDARVAECCLRIFRERRFAFSGASA